jgi:hypothetical protein
MIQKLEEEAAAEQGMLIQLLAKQYDVNDTELMLNITWPTAVVAASPFVRLISHQSAMLFSQNKLATSNQPTVLFSQNKSAPAISHQPNEQAVHCFIA